MNAFKYLADYQKKDVINYLLKKERTQLSEGHRQAIAKNEEQLQDYLSTGYHRFFDDNGYPALTPPWESVTTRLNT